MRRKQTSSSTVAVRSVVATRSEKSEKADLEAPLVLFSLFILCLKKEVQHHDHYHHRVVLISFIQSTHSQAAMKLAARIKNLPNDDSNFVTSRGGSVQLSK